MLPALLKKFIKHCGAAIESLIIKTGWVACFYLATAKVISPRFASRLSPPRDKVGANAANYKAFEIYCPFFDTPAVIE